MRMLELSKATGSLAKYARGLTRESVVLTEDRRPVAALIPLDDADWETVALGTNAKFLRIIEEARRNLRKEGGVSSAQIRRRLGLAPPVSGLNGRRRRRA